MMMIMIMINAIVDFSSQIDSFWLPTQVFSRVICRRERKAQRELDWPQQVTVAPIIGRLASFSAGKKSSPKIAPIEMPTL